MQWIKASERLPGSLIKLNLKIGGKPAWGYFVGSMTESQFHFESYFGFGALFNHQWEDIEWLDESESSPSTVWPGEDDIKDAAIKRFPVPHEWRLREQMPMVSHGSLQITQKLSFIEGVKWLQLWLKSRTAPACEPLLSDEELKSWYPAECANCGYIASSEEWESHAIADTGDYSDPKCPKCGSIGMEDAENIKPNQDQRPYNIVLSRGDYIDELEGKIIDLKHTRTVPIQADDLKFAEKAFAIGYLNADFGDKQIVDVLPTEIKPKWERCKAWLIQLGIEAKSTAPDQPAPDVLVEIKYQEGDDEIIEEIFGRWISKSDVGYMAVEDSVKEAMKEWANVKINRLQSKPSTAPDQPEEKPYNVRKEIDWHNANFKVVDELTEEIRRLKKHLADQPEQFSREDMIGFAEWASTRSEWGFDHECWFRIVDGKEVCIPTSELLTEYIKNKK